MNETLNGVQLPTWYASEVVKAEQDRKSKENAMWERRAAQVQRVANEAGVILSSSAKDTAVTLYLNRATHEGKYDDLTDDEVREIIAQPGKGWCVEALVFDEEKGCFGWENKVSVLKKEAV